MRISDWSSDVCSSDLSLESTSYTVAREIFRARKMPRRAEPQRHHHQCHHRALGPEPGRTVPPLSEPGRDRAGGGVLGGRAPDGAGDTARSEARRVGTEWVSKCRPRWGTCL